MNFSIFRLGKKSEAEDAFSEASAASSVNMVVLVTLFWFFSLFGHGFAKLMKFPTDQARLFRH